MLFYFCIFVSNRLGTCMKKYDFDEIIDRSGTSAYKLELCKWRFGTDDVLPLWVADMDFRTPDFVMDAIRQRCEHEILGYTIKNKEFYTPIINWIQYKHNWAVDPRWIGFVPGIVPAMAVAVLAFSNPGDKVIVQSPVYPPFYSVVENNKRQLAINELQLVDGQYRMNIDELRQLAADPACKLLLLCSPHNPGGRVWSKEELAEVADICAENNVIVVSDEIHADLVLPGYEHIPFATVSEKAKQNSIVLMAPSKTFNIAGLGSSSYIIPNPDLFNTFSRQLQALEFAGGNIFAFVATKAAYEQGADWLNQLIEYIQGNVDFVDSYLKTNIPQVKAIIPQASFLVWLDFSGLGLTDDEVEELLVKKAKIGLNPGRSFGKGGAGFHRLNIGHSRIQIKEALDRLKQAVHNL
jgi:cystathionine beta-lyase